MKRIERRKITFEKYGNEYNIFLALQGYQDVLHGVLFNEIFLLGSCKDSEIEKTIGIFSSCHHDIEIIGGADETQETKK